MEYLPHGLTLDIPAGCFPLSTDTMALAYFARLPRNARVLDLGSGCGTLGLMLCTREDRCHVTGVELTEESHQAAIANIRRNQLEGRLESICADAAQVPGLFAPGSFSVCISNPPYFHSGPASRETPLARREDALPLEALVKSAAWALKFGGDFYLVHKPERLAQIIALGDRENLICKRVLLLRHREGGEISLALLQLRKGAKPGLILEEGALHHPDGSPTGLYRQIYHLEET